MSEPVLCYVRDQWAYFTTRPLADQWGDDWDDAPYEHNAGAPYEWHERLDADRERWTITRVAFEGPFDRPCDGHLNSQWDVRQINAGAVAWLRSSEWGTGCPRVVIPAGTTLSRFRELIREGGGHVYLRAAEGEP